MLDYLYQANDVTLFFIICSFFMLISLVALFLIKWYFPLHLRYQDNTVIGCASALIGLIYGVLAGFATAHLISSSNFAIDALQREANAIVDLYRDSRWLTQPEQAHIQAQVKEYLAEVINVEWPLMNHGERIPHQGSFIIDGMSAELSHYKIKNNSDSAVLSDMMSVIRNLYDARQQRILASYTSLSGSIWVVIMLGTILTLCISYLFGVNFYLHIFTVMASALMMSSIIFLLISLDKPFLGSYAVGPEVYHSLATIIDSR